MPLNHASLQRFSFTILPNASRLDFSSTLLTFYNTTRPLTLLRNIPTCENAKEAGFLVRSPQGSNIQHVSICKIPPNSSKFCNSICLDRLCTSATETESQDFQFNKPHHGVLEVHYYPSTFNPLEIIRNQHTGLPQMWELLDLLIWNLLWIGGHCWGTCSHGSRVGNVFNGHTVRSLGPNYWGWLPWSNTADPPNIHWNSISFKTRIIDNVPNIHTWYIV